MILLLDELKLEHTEDGIIADVRISCMQNLLFVFDNIVIVIKGDFKNQTELKKILLRRISDLFETGGSDEEKGA